jgi:hypothetical protein
MEGRNKVFINKEPTNDHLEYIKDLLEDVDIKEYLTHSFVYVYINKLGGVDVLVFKDEMVYIASKELNVNNKMAIEYIIRKDEISQKYQEMCYWLGINNIKKFTVVVSENIRLKNTTKQYAKDPVYSKSYIGAVTHLVNKGFEDYLYLEDVDEEV